MRKLFNRTLLIIVLSWLVVAYAAYQSISSSQQLVNNAAKLQVDLDLQIWDILHELADDAYARAVVDYSIWDDMVAFAEGKLDTDWARDNLNPGLSSFGIDALWVLGADGSLRYSAMSAGEALISPPPLPLDRAGLEKLMATPDEDYSNVHEFYWFSPSGPMSVFGSDITTTDDPDHTKPGRGYYFVGVRLANDSSLKALATIGATTETQQLDSIPPQQVPTATTPHVFFHPMNDSTGKLAGAIRIERTTEAFTILSRTSIRGRYVTVSLWLLIGFAVTGLILVLSRTQHRASAMAEGMTQQLREANTRLEDRVAERTADLQVDISKREEVEAALLKRTDELERMNKVMMDRELRIVELKKKERAEPGNEPPQS